MTDDERHIKRLRKYLVSIQGLHDELVMQIALLLIKQKIGSKLFRFKDYPRIAKQADELIREYRGNLFSSIKTFSSHEWNFGAEKVSADTIGLLNKVRDKISIEAYENKLMELSRSNNNRKAFESWQTRKVADFSISDRVWNIGRQAKSNLELAIDVALQEGMSAQVLARQIKGNLNNPDALFRRVRNKHGNLVLSRNAKAYRSGRGVYRSAHKNALRLASNEINTAYRDSEQLRIQSNPDVVGIEIALSPQHSIYDMCDELKGRYPKDFKWSSWHVSCKCHRKTILKSEEEFIAELNSNQELEPSTSKNFVEDTPKNYKDWVNGKSWSNTEKGKKKVPTFVKLNK